jgi:hypothetical protein
VARGAQPAALAAGAQGNRDPIVESIALNGARRLKKTPGFFFFDGAKVGRAAQAAQTGPNKRVA